MCKNQDIRLVATDLDGTFLRNDRSITTENLNMLISLGEMGIVRVIATGRNLEKTKEVIAPEIPFDYIVFSSGAGIYDWKKDRLIYYQNIDGETTARISGFLLEKDLNFHLFKAVPENHKCWFHRGSVSCPEFESYLKYHELHAEPLEKRNAVHTEACQFLVVFPGDLDRFISLKNELEHHFTGIKVVRTSSPLQTGYIWMEIFHHSVSKGNGVRFVCNSLGIAHEQTLGIGNDFNDLDLLEFTRYSYVVEESPIELKERYRNTHSNENSAFAHAIQQHLPHQII